MEAVDSVQEKEEGSFYQEYAQFLSTLLLLDNDDIEVNQGLF